MNISVAMPKWRWLEKQIGGEKTVIVPIDSGLSCKTYFILDAPHLLLTEFKETLEGI